MCARTFACSVGPVHVASPSKTFEHGHMVATSKRARCPRPWLILAVLIVSCTIYMAFWKEGIGTKLSHSLWTASVPTVPKPAQMPRLCAHRIVGDESDELGTSLPAAMDTLMDRGIDCFDVDVVQCALAHNCDLQPPGRPGGQRMLSMHFGALHAQSTAVQRCLLFAQPSHMFCCMDWTEGISRCYATYVALDPSHHSLLDNNLHAEPAA